MADPFTKSPASLDLSRLCKWLSNVGDASSSEQDTSEREEANFQKATVKDPNS